MTNMIRFIWLAWQAYKGARRCKNLYYVSLIRNGVPTMSIFVGLGREAWRISKRAIEEFELAKTKELF